MVGWITASSMADNLKTALQHTAIGMGLVFAVLILMILVISLFRFIPNPDAKKKAAASKAAPEAPKASVQAPVVTTSVQQPEELTSPEGDLELIAVITAAIAAATGTSADGFVVRSIKRANHTSNWKKA